ncbi:glycoside hydrolase family 3 protein [Cellulosilyticum sp. I15G10I2]|uniref:glycoside hydrolase family 3 protein n=1 Tax=Cellulosilyticum sp. I15G10I2 TaxID=1892843 RepID=UPI00085CBC34|nr:glycoside hydrolase family 3 N-terminal domain-containing protein [Cellulosilyticum sp. I15G10I2]
MAKIMICFMVILGGIFLTGCQTAQISEDHQGLNPIQEEASILEVAADSPHETIVDTEPMDPIDDMIRKMTLEEKIGQLFIIDIQNDQTGNAILSVNEEVKDKIIKYKIGGVILFKGNISTKEQVLTLIDDMQALSEIPLFIGVDEEGGMVSRIGSNPAFVEEPFKAAFDIGKTEDVEAAYNEAMRMGAVLKELGFNLNFAPVADIYNNDANTVIGTRSFGKTKEQVTPMVISFAEGLLAKNIQPVLKHFPGHGNTQEDSHDGLAYVHKTKEALEEEELVPFIEAIKQSVDSVMLGHLIVEAIDAKYPATLSKKWFAYMDTLFNTSEVLFVTDAMNMGAIEKNYGPEEAVEMSFLAGNDILLMPRDIKRAVDTIRNAYENGRITEERLDQSVKKILSKKVERNIVGIE